MSTFLIILGTFTWTLARKAIALAVAIGLIVPTPSLLLNVLASQTERADVPNARAAANLVQISGATSAEEAAIRRVLAAERFVADPNTYSIVVTDQLPLDGAVGLYEWPEGRILLKRDAFSGRPITTLARILGHELGHAVDRAYLTPAQRQAYLQLRGLPADADWDAQSSPWVQRPVEDFAEVFANLTQPLAAGIPATAFGPVRDADPIRQLFDSTSGTTRSMPVGTAVWSRVALQAVGDITDITSDPIAHVILVAFSIMVAISSLFSAGRRAMNAGRRYRRRVVAAQTAVLAS
jgi:hypothetical protein